MGNADNKIRIDVSEISLERIKNLENEINKRRADETYLKKEKQFYSDVERIRNDFLKQFYGQKIYFESVEWFVIRIKDWNFKCFLNNICSDERECKRLLNAFDVELKVMGKDIIMYCWLRKEYKNFMIGEVML